MPNTPLSLLEKLRDSTDERAWRVFVDLYTPLIQRLLHGQGVSAADADDLTQEVMGVMVRALPGFRHNGRPGAFRRWVRLTVIHRLQEFFRARRAEPAWAGAAEALAALERADDADSELARAWDREHDRHIANRLLETVRGDFDATTWQAFQRLALDEASGAVVAAELGISVNAVLQAKARVLRRLRQEASGILD